MIIFIYQCPVIDLYARLHSGNDRIALVLEWQGPFEVKYLNELL